MTIPASGEKALSMVGKVLPPVAGALAFFADPLAEWSVMGFEPMVKKFANRLMHWRFTNPINLFRTALTFPVYHDNIVGGAIAAIGIPIVQSLLRSFKIPLPDTVNSVLDIFKRTGAGAFAGGAAGAMTWLPGAMAVWSGAAPAVAGPITTGTAWIGDY